MAKSDNIRVLLLLLVGLLAFSLPAYADESIWQSCEWLQPDNNSASPGGTVESGGEGEIFSMCRDYKGFTNKAVKCITRVFLEATSDFIEDFKPYYDDLITAVLLLYTVMFGIRVMMGELTPQYLRYEAPLFLFKFGVVIYFISDIIPWYTNAVCGTGDMLELIASTLSRGFTSEGSSYGTFTMSMACTGELSPGGCVSLNAPSGAVASNYTPLTTEKQGVWNYIDCLLSSFINFSPSTIGPEATKSAQIGVAAMLPLGMSAFGIIIASSLSGYIGMAVFFAGITSLISLLFTLFKAAFHFLVAMIGLSFYFTISGFAFLCLPFKATSKFFWAWVSGVVQYMIMPMILVAFLTLTIWLYDWVLFRSDQSLMRELFQKDEICPEDIQALNDSGFLKFDVTNIANYAKNSTLKTDLPPNYQQVYDLTEDVPEFAAQRQSGFTYNQLATKLPGLNIKSHPAFSGDTSFTDCLKEDACSKDLQEFFMTGLLGALVTLCAITYVVTAFMDQVPTLAVHVSNVVAGAFGGNTVPYSSMKAPLEKNINDGISALQTKATSLGADKKVIGPANEQQMDEFIRSAPEAFTTSAVGDNLIGDVLKGFINSGKEPPKKP